MLLKVYYAAGLFPTTMGNAMPFCAKWKVCRAACVKMVWEAPEGFLRAWMVEEAF